MKINGTIPKFFSSFTWFTNRDDIIDTPACMHLEGRAFLDGGMIHQIFVLHAGKLIICIFRLLIVVPISNSIIIPQINEDKISFSQEKWHLLHVSTTLLAAFFSLH